MIKKNAVERDPRVALTIDCDQVFERLTAGPFPQDELGDDLVHWHLRCCHDCRSFAEAMRPAIGLFHEALAEQARADLPVFTGTLPSDDRVMVAVHNAIQQSETDSRQPDCSIEIEHRDSALRWRIAFAVAASVLLLISFAIGFGTYPLLEMSQSQVAEVKAEQSRSTTSIGLGEPDRPVKREDVEWVASIGCSHADAEMRAMFAEGDNGVTCSQITRICCAKCHASSAEIRAALDVDQVASLVQACGKCHSWNN